MMCSPGVGYDNEDTDHTEYVIGYAQCPYCKGRKRVYQKYGYVFTDKCESCNSL
jgi:hypothetical protein